MIVDAVGVTETDLVDTQPLDRKPTVPLDKLLKQDLVRQSRPGGDLARSPAGSRASTAS